MDKILLVSFFKILAWYCDTVVASNINCILLYIYTKYYWFSSSDVDTILRVNKDTLPNYEDDFVGAAAGLFRLQETYAIPAYDMAEGRIRGKL